MALIWAWSFDVPGLADCEIATSGGWKPMYDAGWSWYSNYSTLTEAAIESLPRHPATGFGGSDRNLRLQGGLRYGSQQKYTYIDSPTVTWSEV
ncbi:MAG: hypothetical protein QF464_03785, partial [Myxococcota bacterium]|nr:hypothetical protein [Myxococcota bacterium]